MAKTNSGVAFCLDRPFDGRTFKKVLADAGYSQTELAKTLGLSSPHEHPDVEVMHRRVRTDSP